MHSVSITLEPGQFTAGWREKSGNLFLPTLSDTRVGDEVAVRIGIVGHPIQATVFGKVALVRRVGRPALPPGVELSLERHSLPAASFLASAARGEPVSFKKRDPRWSAARKLQLQRGNVPLEAVTLNVSEGGCALRWPGPLPLVGDELSIRMKDGFFARTLRAIVCWNQPGSEGDRSVGLKVVAEGRAGRSWRTLVEDVVRSGARAA